MQVFKPLLLLLLAGSTPPLLADEYRQQGAHEHGGPGTYEAEHDEHGDGPERTAPLDAENEQRSHHDVDTLDEGYREPPRRLAPHVE